MRTTTQLPPASRHQVAAVLVFTLSISLFQSSCAAEKTGSQTSTKATKATEFMGSYIRTTLGISQTCGAEFDMDELSERWLASQLRICDMSVWESGYEEDAARDCLEAFDAVPPRVIQGEIQCPRHQTSVPECRSMREVWMEACYPEDSMLARRTPNQAAGRSLRGSADECIDYPQEEFVWDYFERTWERKLACIDDLHLEEYTRESYSFALEYCPTEEWSQLYDPCLAQQGLDRTTERMLVMVVEPEYCDDPSYGAYAEGQFSEMVEEWNAACNSTID